AVVVEGAVEAAAGVDGVVRAIEVELQASRIDVRSTGVPDEIEIVAARRLRGMLDDQVVSLAERDWRRELAGPVGVPGRPLPYCVPSIWSRTAPLVSLASTMNALPTVAVEPSPFLPPGRIQKSARARPPEATGASVGTVKV